MELPLFALHSVLFPGGDLQLRVFEERYLEMMEDVLPEAPFAVAAIRHGQEVGGTYVPYVVGVRVTPASYALAALTPGLVPERQALLEIPGPAERLERLTRSFRQEAALLLALRETRGP